MERKPIAWVCETYEDEQGRTQVNLVREGMTRAEIIQHFPPDPRWEHKKDYNRLGLVKAIIKEAYDEPNPRTPSNVRGFWYERLMWVLTRVMGERNGLSRKLDQTVNTAWRELVESGQVTYMGLNLYSEKEKTYHIQVAENSPYPRTIVVIEKQAFFDQLKDIADTYKFTLCCLGGQSSRAAALSYVDELERMGVDTWGDWTVLSYADFDPEGWTIPEAFCHHLSLRAEGYINLIRLGVLREQLGDSVIEHQAMPYPVTSKTKATKYANFEAEAGGLYVNGRPARVEMNIYTPAQLRERILTGLAEHIDGFEYQKSHLKKAVGKHYIKAVDDFWDDYNEVSDEEYHPYFEAIYDAQRELEYWQDQRAPELRKRKKELEIEIEAIDEKIAEACSDLTEEWIRLENLREWLAIQKQEADTYIDVSGMPSLEDVVDIATSTGDWLKFVDILDIEKIGGEELADFARNHENVEWEPEYGEGEKIQGWISDHLPGLPGVDKPNASPEDLVEAARNGDDYTKFGLT